MTYVITDRCVGVKDAACVKVCPCDCIHPTPDEAAFADAEQLFIDSQICIDCGLCAVECPVQAIFSEDELPPESKHFIQLNAEAFKQR